MSLTMTQKQLLDHDNRQKAIEHRKDALKKRSKRKQSDLGKEDSPSQD